jgi:acyl transferase domain-containing protein
LAPPGYQGPLRVSVNSFGYGGTNAHVILESLAGAISSSALKGVSNGFHLTTPKITNSNLSLTLSNGLATKADPRIFILSAFSEKSLLSAAANLQEWISKYQPDTQTLKDMSHTLALNRSQLPWRFSTVASTAEELTSELTRVDSLKSKVGSFVHIAFVFTGQGAQWHSMGRELISESKIFERSITKSDKLLNSFGCAWSLVEELSKDEKHTRVGEAELSQPATTAIQIALVDFYENLDIKPSRVVGHSSGEIAAAYAAGALSHDAAIEMSVLSLPFT